MDDFKVLVAQPVSPITNFHLWRDNADKIYNSLSFTHKRQGLFSDKVSSEGGKFGRHARVRNKLIDKFLTDDITHVLWFDSDVVEWPHDIIQSLLSVSTTKVVAPYVFLEDNDWWLFKRFYDIECFRDIAGSRFDYKPPYNRLEGDRPSLVQSVGTVFMVPAHLHREIEYDPYYESNEHLFFFDKARESGMEIIATPDIEVRHAFLPKYGETFHEASARK